MLMFGVSWCVVSRALACGDDSLDSSEGPQVVWRARSPRTQRCSSADSCTFPSRRLCLAAPPQNAATSRGENKIFCHDHPGCSASTGSVTLSKNKYIWLERFVYLPQPLPGWGSWCFSVFILVRIKSEDFLFNTVEKKHVITKKMNEWNVSFIIN